MSKFELITQLSCTIMSRLFKTWSTFTKTHFKTLYS